MNKNEIKGHPIYKKGMLFLNKFLSILILFFTLTLIAFGIIIVSSGMPNQIKDKSRFNITFKEKPFALKVSTTKYTFHFTNGDVKSFEKKVENTTSHIRKIFIDIGNRIYDIIYVIKNRTIGYFWRN